jgi:Flp pilus assembly protein TadB
VKAPSQEPSKLVKAPARDDVKTSPKVAKETKSKKTTQPKGRPTPSRKEQQAARRQPLVPEDRKAAKEEERKIARENRAREQRALQTGDERYLPLRDRGPQRRFIRDFVDARYNVGDFVLIALVAVFFVTLFVARYQLIATAIMWIIILLWVLDTWYVWRKIKKRLIAKFGEVEPGSGMYTMNRVLMIRRLRLPKPQVKRGQYPA